MNIDAKTTTSKAETVEPGGTTIKIPGEMPDGSGVVGFIAAVVGAVLFLRRKVSRDNVEVVKDRAETDIIKSLQDQLVKALADRDHFQEVAANAWRTRADDASKIGALTAKVEHLSDVNAKLEQTIAEMRDEMRQMQKKIDVFTQQTKGATSE